GPTAPGKTAARLPGEVRQERGERIHVDRARRIHRVVEGGRQRESAAPVTVSEREDANNRARARKSGQENRKNAEKHGSGEPKKAGCEAGAEHESPECAKQAGEERAEGREERGSDEDGEAGGPEPEQAVEVEQWAEKESRAETGNEMPEKRGRPGGRAGSEFQPDPGEHQSRHRQGPTRESPHDPDGDGRGRVPKQYEQAYACHVRSLRQLQRCCRRQTTSVAIRETSGNEG